MTERLPGVMEHLGIQETSVAPGRVVCRLEADARHQNIQGVIHGSVVMAVLDTAMGHALDAMLEEGEFCSTTQFSLQFQRAARPGAVLEGVGEVVRRGRRIAYLEGTCVDGEGEVIARAHGTWYVGKIRS